MAAFCMCMVQSIGLFNKAKGPPHAVMQAAIANCA
jgi:hypothetical protein